MKYIFRSLAFLIFLLSSLFSQKIQISGSNPEGLDAQTIKPKANHILAGKIQELDAKPFSSSNSSVYWVEPRLRDDYTPSNVNQTERNIQEWCGTMPWWESRNSGQRGENVGIVMILRVVIK